MRDCTSVKSEIISLIVSSSNMGLLKKICTTKLASEFPSQLFLQWNVEKLEMGMFRSLEMCLRTKVEIAWHLVESSSPVSGKKTRISVTCLLRGVAKPNEYLIFWVIVIAPDMILSPPNVYGFTVRYTLSIPQN